MGDIRGRVRAWARLPLAVCFFAVPLSVPGVAFAAPDAVTPVVDCVVVGPSGGVTAVLGYSNPSDTAVTIPHGPQNKVTPARYDGAQPTTFLPGRQRGVFSVSLSGSDGKWMLQGSTVRLSGSASLCPPSTEMPEEGNGTGPAIGLLAAGVLGVVLVRRMRKRLSAAAPGDAKVDSTVQEDGHA